jgi:tRNA threonylcarbamoyladenosine biosynthesis protein TsaB
MLLLALDTSTQNSNIAICSEYECYGEYMWKSGKNHSVEMLENMQRLCAHAQISLSDVELIAVATGPGTFTGVRVALATAKTLALVLQKPLIGVSTLDVIAYQQRMSGREGPVCAILEAGRSEIYAASYTFEIECSEEGERTYRLKQLGDYLVTTSSQLSVTMQEHLVKWTMVTGEQSLPVILYCGEMSENTRHKLYSSLPGRSFFIRDVQATRRAASLATIALQRMRAGQIDDPLALEPLYLRRPSITKSTRKRSLLGGMSLQLADEQTTEREDGALRY